MSTLEQRHVLTFALLLAAAWQAQAGWVSWNNPSSLLNAQGVFPANAGAAYGGTIQVGTQIPVGGEGVIAGIGGLTPGFFAAGVLTPTFAAHLPRNSDGGFTTLGTGYNDLGETYEIIVDFGGMQNGYLPKNTLFSILDLDILENYRNVTALDSSAQLLTSPWLQPLPGAAHHLDWHTAEGDLSGLLSPITVQQTGGTYHFLGVVQNYISSALTFRTTENLSKIRLTLDISRDPVPGSGGPGFAFGTDSVPEAASSSFALFGLAALTCFAAKRLC